MIVPSVALASWWNPFSWHWYNIFNIFFKPQTTIIQPNQNTNQTPIVQTADWQTFTDGDYGFVFSHPLSLKIDVQGPNVSQQNLDAGRTISGTETPSYSTLYFRDSTNKAKFQIDVFHTTDKALTIDNYKNYFYTSGTCDLRYLDAQPSIKIIQENGSSFVQVDGVQTGLPRSCFYSKNTNGNLIVISMLAPDNQSDYDSTKGIIEGVLSTFKFNQYQQQKVTTTGTDYQLLKQPRGDESTRYLDDGVVGSGTYTGYHRIIGLQISGELGRAVSYFVFVTQNYKTFYFDPQLTQNFPGTDDLSLFDQTKVVGKVSGIPINQPATISLGNFVLVRQSYFAADTFDDYTIGKNSNELSNNISGLRFFADQSMGNGFQSPNSSLQDLSNYISGITQVKVVDQFGLLFNYSLVSQENHTRQIQIDQEKTYAENPFYSNADFSSGFSSYLSYDLPFPGGCGGINSSGYVLKNVSMSDLVPVGKTLSGTQLYSFKNLNNPLNKDEYRAKITNVYEAGYQGAQAEAEKLNKGTPEPNFNDYVANNPILIFQDPWNRFIALGEYQYLLMGGCGKPVIYLYPKNTTEVKVSLEKPTQFTADIPTYNNGWDVLANPNGSFKDLQPQYTDCSAINTQVFGSEYAGDACKNNNYPYLYWAGKVSNIYPSINTGWVVAKSDLQSFISEKLSEIGLNQKEISDMTSYWVPELSAKDSPFYRISFFQNKEMNAFAPMSVSPDPDTAIRVFLDWSPLENDNLNIQPETLNHIDRKGFTVVEWGGLKQ